MSNLSSDALDAAIRAIHGESDVTTVRPALDEWDVSHVIAVAPNVAPIIRAIAALQCELTTLLNPSDIADPALHDTVAQMIEQLEGESVLNSWGEIAPVGWGRPHSAAIMNAVKEGMFFEYVAAALIGPCDESAALLCDPTTIAIAIRRWGESSPNAPTSWANALSVKERNRLIAIVQSEPLEAAYCLPWLPPNKAKRVTIDDKSLGYGIDAFASASPTARMQHADMLQYLIVHAQPAHLDALTRLACAMNDAKVWLHVKMLVQRSPDAAYDVVTAVPWNALAERVRTAILECADQSDICAAIAAAQGRTISVNMTSRTAAAFFAALPPPGSGTHATPIPEADGCAR